MTDAYPRGRGRKTPSGYRAAVANAAAQMTIDELAREVGMTARNVRAYQSRGLISSPEVRGRTGYYGPEHVERLRLVKQLQGEGFNLEAIRRLLDTGTGEPLPDVLDFARAVAAPFSDERPLVVEASVFTDRWGDQLTPALVERIRELGFVRPLEDGRWEIRSPALQSAAGELADLGVPLEVAVEITAVLKHHADAVASAYVDLFIERVWRPFEQAGEPEDRWPEVRHALDRLRPLAAQTLNAVFGVVMTEQVEHALTRELAKLTRREA
jgi:DNA-binding transcriptional MerR regulator